MRLTEAVRIGGRLALVIGFVCVNLVFGDSLNYYYGYSNASFRRTASRRPVHGPERQFYATGCIGFFDPEHKDRLFEYECRCTGYDCCFHKWWIRSAGYRVRLCRAGDH